MGDEKNASSAEPSDKSCPICLEEFEDRAFVNACFHSFCFLCIVQWSEVVNTCPLCKTTFTSLIHKVKANDDYEKYDIKSKSIPADQEVSITEARRFRYSTTSVHGRPALSSGRTAHGHSRYRVRDSRIPAPEERRRAVYRAKLWALPIESDDKRPRVRDISANFFRQNPACTHRLVPWLMRELKVVLGGEEHVEFIIQIVLSLLDKVDIEAREFVEHLRPFLHEKTAHFIHEFATYARCPYDMIAYDKKVRYSVEGGDRWDPEAAQVIPTSSIDPEAPGPSGLSSASTFEQRIFEELTTTGWDSPPLLTSRDSPILIEDSSSDEVDPHAATPLTLRDATGTPPLVPGARTRGVECRVRTSHLEGKSAANSSSSRTGQAHPSRASPTGVGTSTEPDDHLLVVTNSSIAASAACVQPRTPEVSPQPSVSSNGVLLFLPLATTADDKKMTRRRDSDTTDHTGRSRKGKERQPSRHVDDNYTDTDTPEEHYYHRNRRRHHHHQTSSKLGRHTPSGCDSGRSPLKEHSENHHRGDSVSPSDQGHLKYKYHHSSTSEDEGHHSRHGHHSHHSHHSSRHSHHDHHYRKHSSSERADSGHKHHHHHHHHKSTNSHQHHHHKSTNSHQHHHHKSTNSHQHHHHKSTNSHQHHHHKSTNSHQHHHHKSTNSHQHHHHKSTNSHQHHHHKSTNSHQHHHHKSTTYHHHQDMDPVQGQSNLPSTAANPISDEHEPLVADRLHHGTNNASYVATEDKDVQGTDIGSVSGENVGATVLNLGPEPREGRESMLLEELSLVEAQIKENKKQVLKAALRHERIELLRKSMHKEREANTL